jgi:hypothetical protein
MRAAQTFTILVLSIFYMTVSYLVMHPRVSHGYRSYYINRDSDLTLKERKSLRPVRLDERIHYDDARVGYDGWHDRETGHRWSAGHTSKILFLLQLEEKKSGMRRLALQVDPLGTQRIAVSINGTLVYSGLLTEKGQVDIVFPTSLLIDDENTLRLDCPDARKTDTDVRKKGVAIAWFTLR